MYRIIRMDGSELAIVDQIMWIKIGASGSLAPAKNRGEAIGVAYRSVPYNLWNYDGIEGAESVMVAEFDGGEYLDSFVKDLAAVENAMCETDSADTERRATRDFEAGELMTVDGVMYRVVLPILAGSPITAGTNVEATTLGAEISRLNEGETA